MPTNINWRDYTIFADVPLCPKIGAVRVTPGERALGRVLKTSVPTKNVPDSEAGKDLVGDTFFSLYKHEPVLKEEVDPERAVNAALLKWLMGDEKFPVTTQSTRHNIAAASAAAGITATTLLQDENIKKAMEKQEQAEEHRQMEKQAIQDMAENMAKGKKDIAQACAKRAAEERQKAEQAAEEGAAQIERASNHPMMNKVMAIAQKKGEEKGEQVAAFMRGWGIEPTSISETDATEIVQFSSQLDLVDLVERLGRYEGIANKAIETHRKNRAGIASEVAITKDFTKIFPTEAAYISPIAPDVFRRIKLLEFMEHGALGWKPVNEGERGGSFKAYVDRSGSMHGDNDMIAKAVTLAVARAFMGLGGDRSYEIVSFDDDVGERESNLAVSSDDDWKAHIKWAQSGTGGGTNFDKAMEHFIKSIKDTPEKEDHTFDLMFLSDGRAELKSETIRHLKEVMEERGVRLFYIEIGGLYNKQLSELAAFFTNITDAQIGNHGMAERISQEIGKMFAKL